MNKCLFSRQALHDVIALLKSCHRRHASANLVGCGKYLPSTNYGSTERPQSNSLLGKQRVEMGNKWAVCIWQRLREATDGKSAAQSNDRYLWKRSPRSLTDTSLSSACGSWVQTSPYRQHAGSTHGDSSQVRVTFYRASRCCYLVKDWLPVCFVGLRALGDFVMHLT